MSHFLYTDAKVAHQTVEGCKSDAIFTATMSNELMEAGRGGGGTRFETLLKRDGSCGHQPLDHLYHHRHHLINVHLLCIVFSCIISCLSLTYHSVVVLTCIM